MLKMQRKLGDDEDKHKACETVIRFKCKNIDFYGKWNEMYVQQPLLFKYTGWTSVV